MALRITDYSGYLLVKANCLVSAQIVTGTTDGSHLVAWLKEKDISIEGQPTTSYNRIFLNFTTSSVATQAAQLLHNQSQPDGGCLVARLKSQRPQASSRPGGRGRKFMMRRSLLA